MGNRLNRQTLRMKNVRANRLSRLRISLVVALVAFAVSGIGTMATEKSDLALRDNPPAIAPEERDRSRLDFEFHEQNWNLKTGEVLDTGTPAAAGQNDGTSTVSIHRIYRVGPRLR
jgi:hypothetical protein